MAYEDIVDALQAIPDACRTLAGTRNTPDASPRIRDFWQALETAQQWLNRPIPPDVLQALTSLATDGKPWDLAIQRTLDAIARPMKGTNPTAIIPTSRLRQCGSESERNALRKSLVASSRQEALARFEAADFSTWPALLTDLERLVLDLQAIRGRLPSLHEPKPSDAAPKLQAGPVGEPQDPAAGEHHEYLITLQQAAAMVSRSKKTLERRKTDSKFPTPRVAGGGGKPDEYAWSEMRLYLEREFDRKMPEHFPTAPFVRS